MEHVSLMRIKGMIGKIDEPDEPDHGMFVYTISVCSSDGVELPSFPSVTRGPYSSEEEALVALNSFVADLEQSLKKKDESLYFEHLKKPIEEYDA